MDKIFEITPFEMPTVVPEKYMPTWWEKSTETVLCLAIAFFTTAYLAEIAPDSGCFFLSVTELMAVWVLTCTMISAAWVVCIQIIENIWLRDRSLLFR